MAQLPFYWIDAFTTRAFGGNPAAIVPLSAWLPDDQLQQLATQHGLSETAYYVPTADGFHLRWFTPECEVDLCGHATLAAATVVFDRSPDVRQISFESQSGLLRVTKDELDRAVLDFPSRPPAAAEYDDQTAELLPALGLRDAVWIGKSRDHLVVLPDQKSLSALQPDFGRLLNFDRTAVTVTAPGDECDFVSRHFAPGFGIDEDPVTGSAHCSLTPYWAHRLQKNTLHARQISARGGELWCSLNNDRVSIAGKAVIYLRGQLEF